MERKLFDCDLNENPSDQDRATKKVKHKDKDGMSIEEDCLRCMVLRHLLAIKSFRNVRDEVLEENVEEDSKNKMVEADSRLDEDE
ncbi:hypothetical protein JCGZ_22074 [Jatropha curcas]|uniref:Uncharacterized protein n=1 Tax=Jatropha curcas TaxID=180498 RepID=A0A067JT53_JATCU|nr:hypothetical protein JCGZ_22074 [Jatropha curcas]